VSLAVAGGVRGFSSHEAESELVVLNGQTMGTTWTVKLRGEVQNPAALEKAVAKEFDWTETMTSHWRTNTDLSIFNRTASTNPIAVPWPVTKLTRMTREISEASGGAFDITVGPLVRLWGFGPAPRRETPPGEDEIERLRESWGWEKLEILDLQLRKQHPGLEIDLSAIAPGWAADQIAALLEGRGYQEFLVETGGELRALGRWKIAIEHPTRTCTLTNESIGTSGSYRQQWESGGRRYSHLLDPRTGRPIAHRTVSVSVAHSTCALADAWAAALNVMGVEAGLPLAESLGLAAQFVVEKENGALELRSSAKWGRR
jgi:thiamine biosynthesis lipoprotein